MLFLSNLDIGPILPTQPPFPILPNIQSPSQYTQSRDLSLSYTSDLLTLSESSTDLNPAFEAQALPSP